jgi:hypothetical protein
MHRLVVFLGRETGSVAIKLLLVPVALAVLLLGWFETGDLTLPLAGNTIEARLGTTAGTASVAIGSVALRLGRDDQPAGLVIKDVVLSDDSGRTLARASEVTSGFSLLQLLTDRFQPSDLTISGGQALLRRYADGRLALSLGAATPPETPAARAAISLAGGGFLARVPLLAGLDHVSFQGIEVVYDDARSGTYWVARDSSLEFRRGEGRTDWLLRATPEGPNGTKANVTVRATQETATGATVIEADFAGARPDDLAAQVPSLGWLAGIDAAVSGRLATRYAGDGTLLGMSGTVDLGQGTIRTGKTGAVHFEQASATFRHDPRRAVLGLENLVLRTSLGDLAATGDLFLEQAKGSVTAIVAQLELDRLLVRDGRMVRNLEFDEGRLDFRLGLKGQTLDIGNLTLRAGTAGAHMSGRIALSGETGQWRAALEGEATGIPRDLALAFWPLRLFPGTRTWLDRHIHAGRIDSAKASFRLDGGQPRYDAEFTFSGAEVTVLATMPRIEAGTGSGSFANDRLRLWLDGGHGRDAAGQSIDLAGSTFAIADVRQSPSTGEAVITASGRVSSMLDIIDRAPLRFLSRLNQTPDLADGEATVRATLTLPMSHQLTADMVEASAVATITDVSSTVIVPGRKAEADWLNLSADRDGMRISGRASLSGVPFDMVFDKGFTVDAGPGRVSADFPLSVAHLQDLGIDLPKGALSGSAPAKLQLTLDDRANPSFALEADLGPSGVTVAALDWTKAPGQAAQLSVSGRLGAPADIHAVRLAGPGLLAEGDIDLGRAGLARADFSRLAVGGWLDASLSIHPGAGGRSIASIDGGMIDLRSVGSGGSGSGYDLLVRPDRLIVSDGIELTSVDGRISTRSGLAGPFTGRVNGGARIEGRIDLDGTIYFSSPDGGAALRDAGIYPNARGGQLNVALEPDARAGGFRGRFNLTGTRVRNAPALAELLRVASVVGIADALSGPGIGFSDVSGRFHLAQDRVTVQQARAISASLGISVNGTYETAGGALDLEGVVSPLYFVNGFFESLPGIGRLLGGRDGEGLIGVTYSMKGPADRPRIRVNPLTLLTPGAFREIFQREPGREPPASRATN